MENNKYKFISCKTITYARVETLQEAIHSFLIQDYPAEMCELIIVNDYPLQKLVFEHPRVKIFNLDKTFDTIGEKENFAIEQCQGELIAVWDDDDIALSNHLSNINEQWKEDTNIIHWRGAYYNDPNITSIEFIGNSGIVYSKNVWERIGKSPLENAGGDMTLVNKIHALGGVTIANLPSEGISWFYRWSMPTAQIYHQSGAGYDVPGKPNIIQRHSQHIERLKKQGKIPTGIINLQPHWKQDYKQLLINFINKK